MTEPETAASPTDPDSQGLVRSFDHAISLPVFEGPLDLLLFLIRRNEIDIYDIPIETVTRQYLTVLRGMEKMQLEVAGEFFVMAATLMQIKSRLLLPKHEQKEDEGEGEDEVDPRWELVQQLVEYKRFKEAATGLEALIERARDLVFREYIPGPEDLPERELRPTDRIELWNVFNQVLRRLAEKVVVGEIEEDSVTVADRMEFLLAKLRETPAFLFTEVFAGGRASVPQIVCTFLAILELTRLKRMTIEQATAFADIRCTVFVGEEGTAAPDGLL
ncbi:MAG: segregation/condensation protein A [Opitutales bacterium]|nr:segregation/condensation protein A [Opitutales bacterium]